MTGHLSLDTLRGTRLPRIKDTLLEPIFIQLQGYPLRWLTTLNFSIFSLTKLDFTYYSLLCFVICSHKLYQTEAISLNVFPPARAICRDRFWSVKMDTSLELTMTDGCFLRSSPESAKFSVLKRAECYEIIFQMDTSGFVYSRPAKSGYIQYLVTFYHALKSLPFTLLCMERRGLGVWYRSVQV